MSEEYESQSGDENMDTETEEESDSDSTTSSSSTSSSSNPSSSDYEPEPVKKITLKVQKDGRARRKWKLLTENKKGFKKEWLDMYDWVEEDPKNTLVAYCKVCDVKMKSLKTVLDAHEKTKKHFKNVNAPAKEEFVDEPKKEEKPETKATPAIGLDQITDEQIAFFAESQADAAHQAVTSIIDKLVEKYHERRVQNLKLQNEAKFQLNVERTKLIRSENRRKLERRLQKESYKKEAEEVHLKFIQQQHEIKLRAMEDERDAKLRAVEQELVFAKQEYEKKVRLLDSQLSSMK